MLLGRVPAERHEHYAPDGTLTGFTVVVREPEWLDSDVRQMLELGQVEAESCPGCGYHESLADDDDVDFGPVTRVCPVCAGDVAYRRHLESEDRKFDDEAAKPLDPRPADGRWVRMAVLSPDEVEKRQGGPGGDTR